MGKFDDILDEFEEGLLEKEKINLVAFVVDRSGSMAGSEKFVMNSFNEQLKIAKEQTDQETLVSLVSFATVFSGNTFEQKSDLFAHYFNRHVDNVEELKQWPVGGGTPLHDAVGHTITKLKATVEEFPGKDISVLVLVITDGRENQSKEYSGPQLKKIIKELEGQGNWTVTYLGSSSDMSEDVLFAEAQNFGVSIASTASFKKSRVGYANASKMMRSSMTNFYNERTLGNTQVVDYWKNSEGEEEKTDEEVRQEEVSEG